MAYSPACCIDVSGGKIAPYPYPSPRQSSPECKVLPAILPALGFLSIAFAVALLFIPPSQIDMGGYFQYAGKIIGGAVLAVVVAEYIYHRAQKRNARLSMAGGK